MSDFSVLIIDDDIWMQRILSRTLQSYGFKTTYLASNGFEGISVAVENKPSLIIMDILMPELSGHLTLKVLKHIKSTKDIPVLMVSAMSDTENLGLAIKSGTSGFISKPFTRATVYEKLVGIFGKEKLDMISRGELYDNLWDDSSKTPDVKPEIHAPEHSTMPETPSVTEEDNQTNNAKSFVSPDQILQHYHDDEKRSIESIKKLLLKTKK